MPVAIIRKAFIVAAALLAAGCPAVPAGSATGTSSGSGTSGSGIGSSSGSGGGTGSSTSGGPSSGSSTGSRAPTTAGGGTIGGATGAPDAGAADAGGVVPSWAFGMDYDSFFAADAGFPVYTGSIGKVPGVSWYYTMATLPDGGACDPLEQALPADDPSNACYDWRSMDEWAESALSHSLPVIYDFNHAPAYAAVDGGSTCTLLDEAAVSGFASALAKRYNSSAPQAGCPSGTPSCHGVIRFYEEWNEINDWTCNQRSWPQEALQASWIYQAVKSVDPGAIVGAPNMGWGVYAPAGTPVHLATPDFTVWLDDYLSAGGDQVADAVGFHAYGVNASPYDGIGVYNTPALGCDSATDQIGCAGQPLLDGYNAVRAVMAKHGLGDRRILISEGGWGDDASNACAAPLDQTGCLTLSDQPNYAARWIVLLASTWSDGLGVMAQWYDYSIDWGTLNASVEDGAQQSTEGAAAWDQAASWVIGARFGSQCSQAPGSTLFVCDFASASGRRSEVVFNDDAGATASYTVPPWATIATALLGSAAPVAAGSSLAIGNAPVLFQ